MKRSKLIVADVLAMRARKKAGERLEDIAAAYGIAASYARKLISGERTIDPEAGSVSQAHERRVARGRVAPIRLRPS